MKYVLPFLDSKEKGDKTTRPAHPLISRPMLEQLKRG